MKPFPADFNNNHKVSAEEAYTYAAPRATNFYPSQHAQIWDGILGEANLTIIPQIIIGGILMPSNRLRIAAFYLVLPALFGIFSMFVYKYRRVLRSQFSRR